MIILKNEEKKLSLAYLKGYVRLFHRNLASQCLIISTLGLDRNRISGLFFAEKFHLK